MIKALYFLRDNGGCGWYRVNQPLTHAGASKLMQVRRVEKGAPSEEIEEKINWCDIIIVPRLSEGPFIYALKEFRNQGKKVVIDWDDNIFCVSPLSPHYEDYGTENYSHNYPGGRLDVWVDKKNIDLEKNKKRLEAAKNALSMCDMITCTTDTLASVMRQFNDNVKVLPNCIDVNLWQKLNFSPRNNIRMGWFGGHSHYEDWLVIANVLPEFMKANPNVTLVLMGAKFDGTLRNVDPARIEYHPWVDTNAYPYKAAILDLDFAVIPLLHSKFNICKSAIKWIEMASLSVPSVTSYVTPYKEMADIVQDNGIFIENNNAKEWMEGLNLMVNDTQLRKKMSIAARKTVEDHCDINNNFPLWITAYEECLSWNSKRTLATA